MSAKSISKNRIALLLNILRDVHTIGHRKVRAIILKIFSRNEKKSNFKRGGDILLAPNGKPSNLTFKQ